MNTLLKDYYTSLHIDERVFDYCQKIEDSLKDRFAAIDAICEINQMKVIKAMQDNRLAEAILQVPPDMVIPMTDEMHSNGSMQMYPYGRCAGPFSDHLWNTCNLYGVIW